MKQVTGSNTALSANKVSIQLALDGHSFSAAGLTKDFPGSEPVEAGVMTPRTLLVPEGLFDADNAGALLSAAGMPAADDDCVVWSAPLDGIVAVMAAGAGAVNAVQEKLGDRVRYTSPLLHTPSIGGPTVWMCPMAGLLYIKVYNPGLLLAEVIPAPAEADILYFTERLNACYPIEKYTLRLAGNDTKALHKLLKKRFKEILCE